MSSVIHHDSVSTKEEEEKEPKNSQESEQSFRENLQQALLPTVGDLGSHDRMQVILQILRDDTKKQQRVAFTGFNQSWVELMKWLVSLLWGTKPSFRDSADDFESDSSSITHGDFEEAESTTHDLEDKELQQVKANLHEAYDSTRDVEDVPSHERNECDV